MARPRSVLFIIADDWSRIARCYGDQVIRLPHIDALAERGTVFGQAYCTSPSCAVSRACILTGHHSHTHGQFGHCHGIHGFQTHGHMTSTPGILRERGFATALIGKKHVRPDAIYPFEYEPAEVNDRSPASLGENVRKFLDVIEDRPFYCQVAPTDPHRGGPGFANERMHAGEQRVTYRPEDVPVPSFLPDNDATRADLADYYTSISRWDQSVGACVQALRDAGRADDTLIVVTTDHAMPFPGAKATSFDSGHHCPLIVVAPGQTRTGHTTDAMVSWVDFFPTIMSWCGIDPAQLPPCRPIPGAERWRFLPGRRPGRSFLPVLETEHAPGWDRVFFSHNFHEITNYYPYRVVRDRRYKFVLNLAHELPCPIPTDLYRSKTWSAVRERGIDMMGQRPTHRFLYQDRENLYDMAEDPAEARNLIHAPHLQEQARTMRKALQQFRVDTVDPWLELSFQRGMSDVSLDD